MKPITLNHFGRRTAFIQMLKERGAKVGAEIGTDHGKYAQQLFEGIPDLKLTCVDPYVAYTEGKDVKTQDDVDKIYEEAFTRMYPYDAKFMRMISMKAVRFVPDNSLDFVFIDGNHEYSYVSEDITEWTKKVKPGGIVAGHDYTENAERGYGVIEAVNEYTKENHIAPWFILHAGGSLVDCWMFIKS